MKTTKISTISNTSKTQKASPLVNAMIAAVLLLAALPVAVIGFLQVFPPIPDARSKVETVEEAKPKTSAAERRAQRREAREAKKALAKNTPNQGESAMQNHLRTVHNIIVSEEGYDALDFYSGFGPGNDFDNMFPDTFPDAMNNFGFVVSPGPGADMNGFGPGFGPGADMNGFGPGFGPVFGPGADMEFNGGFGGFGGGFGPGFGA